MLNSIARVASFEEDVAKEYQSPTSARFRCFVETGGIFFVLMTM